jgi:hypothetical protein
MLGRSIDLTTHPPEQFDVEPLPTRTILDPHRPGASRSGSRSRARSSVDLSTNSGRPNPRWVEWTAHVRNGRHRLDDIEDAQARPAVDQLCTGRDQYQLNPAGSKPASSPQDHGLRHQRPGAAPRKVDQHPLTTTADHRGQRVTEDTDVGATDITADAQHR